LRCYFQGDLIVDFAVVYCYDFEDLVVFCRFAGVPAKGMLYTELHAGETADYLPD
jgi:hypothetical protein